MAKARVSVYFHPLDIPKTYYQGIGEVIARMALFEYHLMDAISIVLKIQDPKQKRVVLMSMGIDPKLGILQALVNNWVLDGKVRGEFATVIKGAQLLKRFRHKVAHGVWGHEKGKKKMHLLYIDEPKDVYLPKSMPLTSRNLRYFANAIRNLDMALLTATNNLRARAP